MALLLRAFAVMAYFWVAHRAVSLENEILAGLGLALLVFIVFIGGVLQMKIRAVAIAAVFLLAIWGLIYADAAMTTLLFVPSIFLLMAARLFGRTLVNGRTPLLVSAASLVEGATPATLDDEVRIYTTRLTRAWAIMLALLAVINLFLAIFAVPDGVLARAGYAVPAWVSSESATRYMPWLIYLSVTGFLVGEFFYRQRRFPGRYRSAVDYIRRLVKVPMKSWQAAFAEA